MPTTEDYEEQYRRSQGGDTPAGTGDIVFTPPATDTSAGDDDNFFDPNEWKNLLAQSLGEQVFNAGLAIGETKESLVGFFSSNFDDFLDQVDNDLFVRFGAFGLEPGSTEEYYTQTGEGWNRLMAEGYKFYGGLNSDLTPFLGQDISGSRSTGGGGRRLPTAAEIRQGFDLDQLANRVDSLSQSQVLEPYSDPRGLARAYVDSVVASNGQQDIDFDTFVNQRIEDTPRYKSIFRNKPPGLSAAQYIQPIYSRALQVDPNQAGERAIGAAQFGASASEFESRLNRTDAVTGSSPYLNKLQGRVSALKGIFKG